MKPADTAADARLTKTERAVYTLALQRGRYSVEYGRMRGSWAGRFRPVEIRAGRACRSLAAKGLVSIVRDEPIRVTGHGGRAFSGRLVVIVPRGSR